MSQFQPTRRTLFGDLFTAVFGCVVAQKIAHVIASPTTGITTFSYDSATGTMTTMDTSGKITTYCYDVHGRCLPST
jgi:hypothetical protein